MDPMGTILELLDGFGGKLTLFGILAAVLGFFQFKVFSAGKKSVENKAAQQAVKDIKRAREIENETEQLAPRDVDRELRDNGWMRDESDR